MVLDMKDKVESKRTYLFILSLYCINGLFTNLYLMFTYLYLIGPTVNTVEILLIKVVHKELMNY